MTLILGALFVIGITVLVLGVAKASYGRAERRARSKDGPRWR